MGERIFYSVGQFQNDAARLCRLILNSKPRSHYKNIFAVPRGGIPLGIAMSLLLKIPMIDFDLIEERTLIVDDIIDSGKTRLRYPNNDFACIHLAGPVKCQSHTYYLISKKKNSWIDYFWEGEAAGSGIQDNVIRILQFIGEDPTRKGLIETPERVERSYRELFRGYHTEDKPRLQVVPNGEDGVFYDEMLQDEGYFFSHCEHHMLPFFGQYYFGYIPDKLILGASKIGRLVDYHSARLQIAERLCHMVVQDVEKEIKPFGSILVMRARHMCKEMRGLRKWNSPYEARAVTGYFRENKNNCKMEFMASIVRDR